MHNTMRSYRHKAWGLIIFLLAAGLSLYGQVEQLDIHRVEVVEGANQVKFYFSALDGRGKPVPSEALTGKISIAASIDGEDQPPYELLDDDPVLDTLYKEVVSTSQDTFLIDLLVDVSQEMGPASLDSAAALIDRLREEFPLSAPSRYRLRTFARTISDTIPMGTRPTVTQEPAYLYEALDQVLKEWKFLPGRKALILFSPGRDEAPDTSAWRWRTREDINFYLDHYRDSTELNGNWIFTIGLGNDISEDALRALSDKTNRTNDGYYAGTYPDSIIRLKGIQEQILFTHTLAYVPDNGIFTGAERCYQLILANELTSDPYCQRFGSPTAPLLLRTVPASLWFFYLVIGLFTVFALFLLSVWLLPQLRQQQFKKHFVRPYEPAAGRRQLDPFTNLPIEAGELVVHRCPQVTTWESWKAVGYQCMNYPDCIRSMPHLNCSGQGAPEDSQEFFAMSGINRYLNWALFGMAGGLLGWICFAMVKAFAFGGYRNLVQNLAQNTLAYREINVDFLANQTLIGMAFGLGMTVMLATVEELGQSRHLSILRILLRSLVGIVLVSFLFVGSFLLHFYQVLDSVVLTDGLTWLLFGLIIGLVLSINSTISLTRGLLGGALAGVVAFVVYLAVANLFADYNLAKLISLLLMSGLLGLVLVSVVAAAEDLEIEYLSPVKYHRTVPISKWLKQGVQVDIGTSQNAYVPVKWPDPEAKDRHAVLQLDNQQVYLLALAETLVNDRLIGENKRIALHHNDIIQLGRRSMSKFRFRSSQPGTSPVNQDKKGGAAITIHKNP